LKTLDTLFFEHSSSVETFKELDPDVLGKSLYALVYELPSNSPTAQPFSALENLLMRENQECGIGILHERSSNFCNFYLMVHRNVREPFNSVFKGSKLALFKLNFKDLFNMKPSNYLKYLNELSSFTQGLYHENQKISSEILNLGTEIDDISKVLSISTEKNGRLKKKIVTAKNLIKKLAVDCESSSGIDTVFCVYCKINRKDVLLLPCGDLFCCKTCLMSSYKIPVNLQMKKQKVKCPKCKKIIEQAKEVFY
jgi:hypothetical protein